MIDRRRLIQGTNELNRAVQQRDNQRKIELAKAYSELGGSNTALTPNYASNNPTPTASIPTLEKAVVSQYEEAENSGGIQNFANNITPTSFLNIPNIADTIRGQYGDAIQENANLYNEIKNYQTQRTLESIGQADNTRVEKPTWAQNLGDALLLLGASPSAKVANYTPEMREAGLSYGDLIDYNRDAINEEASQRRSELVKKHPIIGSIAATLNRPMESAEGVLQNLGEYATGRALSQTDRPSSEMREAVNENINSNIGRGAYGVVNSMGDMTLAMLIAGGNPKIASALMGVEKANDVMNDANARGLSPEQILVEGGLSGVSTGITERFPMGRLGTSANIFASAASEGAQEGLEDIADNFFDDLVTKYGGNSEKSTRNIIYNAYIEAGYTPEEAKKATESEMWKQVGLDALLGAITGGTMQLGGNFIRGNNAITGKPRTQTEVEAKPESEEQTIPTLNSRAEESAIQERRNEELARLSEEYAQIRQTEEERARAEQQAREVENNSEEMQFMRDLLADTSYESRDWQTAQTAERNSEEYNFLKNALSDISNDAQNWEIPSGEEQQNIPELNSVIQRAESAVNTFLNGYNSNVLGREEALDLRNELVALGNQNPEARGQISNLWKNVVNAINSNNVVQNSVISNEAQDQHTPEQNRVIQEYNNSSDERLANWIAARRNGETRDYPIPVARVTNEVAEYIKNELGISTYGNDVVMNNSSLRHIDKHIDNPNKSPITDEDISRIGYVLENPDEIVKTGETTTSTRLSDNSLAPTFIMRKRIDGHYYVVEAATDAKTKNNVVVTAFIEQAGKESDKIKKQFKESYHVPNDIAEASPSAHAQSGHDLDSSAESVPQEGKKVNSSQGESNLEQNARDNEGLPEDVANIQNVRDAQAMLESEIDSLSETYPLNTQFFGGGNEDTDVDMDEESITDQRRREFHTGIYKDSKVSTNSFPRSKALNKTEMNTVLNKEQKQYEAVTHEATLERATNELKEDGYKASVEDILTKKDWDAVDTDKAMLCAFKSAKEARYKTKHGADPTKAWQQTVDLFKTIREHATVGGQAIEALKKWASRTPEGKLAKAIAFARELAETADPKSEAAKQIAKQNNVVFTDEFMAEFLEKAHQYDDQEVSFAKQARLDQELAHMVWSQIPKDWKSKFTSLWMDNLLASFRTLISRNVGGNTGKYLLDQTATKAIAGPIDTLISRLTGGRTTTGLTKEGFKVATQGLRQGAFNTTMDYWGANLDPDKVTKFKDLVKEFGDINTAKENFFADAKVSNRSGSNESDFNETLKNNRTVFETKLFKTYDKLIKYGLAVSDNMFYKAVYDQTMYELNTLRKNGKLEKALQDLSDEKFETWAKATATAQGLEAVYQNDSELSKGATKIKEGIGKMAKDMIGVDFVSSAAFPFLRTPMNVIRTNLEFSPLGIVRNGVQTIKEIRNNLKNNRAAFTTDTSGGSFNQGRFVRETSRNIVGSLLFGLALVMKNAGLLTGGYSDDDREKQAQKDAGMQEYAFVNPLNGNQYSVDWIPALGSNLVGAAAFDDAFRKPDQSTLDAVINGAKAGSKSLFEQSALQGLQRLVGQQSYNNEDSVIDNVINTVTNTASSAAVPAFVRQTAAVLDPYKRNTYGMGGRESVINNFIAGIPILRQNLLQPRIGSNGQPMEQNAGRNLAQKMFDNLVNPAMVTVPSALEDPVRDEATRLFEATKDTNAYQPKIGLSYLNVDGHQATTEEYTEFLQIADSAMNQIAGNFIQTPFYSHLTDEQKVNALNNIYGAVQRVERAKYLGLDKDFDGADKAYAEGGAEGLLDFITAQNALSDLGIANNEENRNAVLQTLNANGGDLSALTSQYQGTTSHTFTGLDDIMNNEYRDMLSMLSDDNMTDLRFDINSVVNGVEFNSMTGLEKDYQGAKKAYDNGGVNGLAEYMFPAAVLNQYGMDNSEKNRQVVMDAYNEGGASAVRTQLNAMQTFANSDYGEGLISDYNHAAQYLPTLNPQQFTNLYDDINQQSKGETGFNNITQQEIIDYLNRDPNAYNSETALQYWNAFDQNAGTDKQWKKVPVLQNGTWVLKKEDRPVTIPTVTTPTTTTPSTTTQTSSATPVTPASIGQYGRGNIDLYNRPQFIQPDGSISTVNSMSFNDNGKEVLIPTIAYDRNGKPYQMTDDEAIQRYRQTGEYLGKFDTVEEADAYAQALHLQQEMLYR